MRLPVIFYIDLSSNALPLAAGALERTWEQEDAKFVFSYVLLSALTELSSFLLGLLKIRNLVLLHIYGIVAFLLLMRVFALWQQSSRWKKILRLAVLLYIMFWVYAKVFIEPISQLPNYSESASGALLSGAALLTLVNLTRSANVELLQDVRFWTCIGILINSGGNVPLYALSTKLVSLSMNQVFTVWRVHSLLSIIVNLCFMSAFLCLKRR